MATTVGKTSKDPLGLSIEGLAAGPAGSLLFGFRAPVHGGKALVVRLDDPIGLAGGKAPMVTGPRWVPLGDRGIRSLEQDGEGWLVLARGGYVCSKAVTSELTNARDAVDRIQTEGWESDARTRQEALQSIAMRDVDNRLRPVVVPVGRGADHFQEIHRTLARMELTDGLQLPQMLIESQSRLARDASVIVIVQEVDETAALALGLLRRQGYAVSAIINHHEQDVVNQAAGRLIAERIPVAHLHDEQSISRICSALLLKY